MAISYCNKAHAACGTTKFIHTEFEIASLVTQTPSSFPSFAVHSASNGKLGGSLLTLFFFLGTDNIQRQLYKGSGKTGRIEKEIKYNRCIVMEY